MQVYVKILPNFAAMAPLIFEYSIYSMYCTSYIGKQID